MMIRGRHSLSFSTRWKSCCLRLLSQVMYKIIRSWLELFLFVCYTQPCQTVMKIYQHQLTIRRRYFLKDNTTAAISTFCEECSLKFFVGSFNFLCARDQFAFLLTTRRRTCENKIHKLIYDGWISMTQEKTTTLKHLVGMTFIMVWWQTKRVLIKKQTSTVQSTSHKVNR